VSVFFGKLLAVVDVFAMILYYVPKGLLVS